MQKLLTDRFKWTKFTPKADRNFPKCRKCKRAIKRIIDGKCLQKATVTIKEVWEHKSGVCFK